MPPPPLRLLRPRTQLPLPLLHLPALVLRSHRFLNLRRAQFPVSLSQPAQVNRLPSVRRNRALLAAQDRPPLLPLRRRHAAIAVRSPAQLREAAGQVVLAPASPCVLSSPARAVPLLPAPVGPEVGKAKALLVVKVAPGASVQVQCPWVRARGHALPAVHKCFHRCPTRCRQRRSRASRFMRGTLLSASVLLSTSAKLKGSARFTRRASVPALEAAASPPSPLLRRNHARRAKSDR